MKPLIIKYKGAFYTEDDLSPEMKLRLHTEIQIARQKREGKEKVQKVVKKEKDDKD